jgi:hypothetical protein
MVQKQLEERKRGQTTFTLEDLATQAGIPRNLVGQPSSILGEIDRRY